LLGLLAFVEGARAHLGWIVAAAFAVLLGASFFAYHREQTRRLAAPRQHVDRLRAVTQSLAAQVIDKKRPLTYSDGSIGAFTLRQIWREHAPTEAAFLDAYEASARVTQDARAAVVERLNEDANKLDLGVGWSRSDLRLAALHFIELQLSEGGNPSISASVDKLLPNPDGSVPCILQVKVGVQGFIVWGENDASQMPTPDQALVLIEELKGSVEMAKARLAQLVQDDAENKAFGALEAILGRDAYFPGDCTDLCRSPDPS
jgi:hypothetical protein